MLQRDYFIRIIQEFMAALAAFLEKEKDTPDKGLKELYRQYVGDYDTLRNLTTDELLGYAKEQWKAEERVDRIEMVAELLYAEASLRQNPLRDMLMQKAFRSFDYVDTHSNTFSIGRKQKMATIQQELRKAKSSDQAS